MLKYVRGGLGMPRHTKERRIPSQKLLECLERLESLGISRDAREGSGTCRIVRVELSRPLGMSKRVKGCVRHLARAGVCRTMRMLGGMTEGCLGMRRNAYACLKRCMHVRACLRLSGNLKETQGCPRVSDDV